MVRQAGAQVRRREIQVLELGHLQQDAGRFDGPRGDYHLLGLDRDRATVGGDGTDFGHSPVRVRASTHPPTIAASA